MTENEAKLLEKLDDLANDLEVDMYSVATLNAYFEECGNAIRGLLEEIQALRAIGTIEELQALKEKSVAKKVKEKEYVNNYLNFTCPKCNNAIFGERFEPHHCKWCGQKLDWE